MCMSNQLKNDKFSNCKKGVIEDFVVHQLYAQAFYFAI